MIKTIILMSSVLLALSSPRLHAEELPGELTRIIKGTEKSTALGTVILHLDFENDNWAKFSRNQKPVKSFGSELVEGRVGKAASIFNNSQCGDIDAEGNLEKARGTIMFWYKPLFTEGSKDNYSLLISGKMTGDRVSPTYIWIQNGNLQFDYASYKGDGTEYITVPIDTWKTNEWKHISCSWDNTQGAAIAVDGRIVAEKARTWEIEKGRKITIGGDGVDGPGWVTRKAACGLLDELLIFNVPLSEKQMKAHFEGKLEYSYVTPLEKNTAFTKQRDPVFKLTFDGNFDSLCGKDKGTAVKNENVVMVPGYRGQAAKLGEESSLQYAGNSQMTRMMGTVSFWLKLDREPAGNGFPIRKISTLSPPMGSIFTAGDTVKNNNIRLEMDDFLWLRWSKNGQANSWGSLLKQLFVNEWHNYVVTWDAGTGICALYFDGKMLGSRKEYEFGANFLENIFLGKTSDATKSFAGSMDELMIYNYAMTSAEVLEHYASYEPIVPALLDYCLVAKRANSVRMKWLNIGGGEKTEEFSVVVKDPAQKSVFEKKSVISLLPGKELIETLAITPLTEGMHTICIYRNGELYRKRELLVIDDAPIAQGRPLHKVAENPAVRVIDDIDCATEYGTEKYRDDLKTKVVKKEFGSYRESPTDKLSGFAYRINTIAKPGTPHWLEVEYPDDAMRTFYVVVLQEKYNHVDAKGFDTIGIITGGNFPLSMKLQKKRLLFWPDSTNIMVGCYSYQKFEKQSGPALARIKVSENDGPLPVLSVNSPADYPQRKIGIWNEDPTMPAYAWFNQDTMYDNIDLDFWRIKYQRTIEYLLYSGHNEWNIMCSEYNGDIASDPFILPRSCSGSICGYVPGWAGVAAAMLERDKIDFFASVHAEFNDDSGIVAGLFGSAYGADMSEVDRMGENSVNRMKNDNSFVKGGFGTSVDPLHPAVQEAHLRMVRVYCEMFKPYRHFKGIRFITGAGSLYYSDITQGYGDYNLKTFEKDTGIKVPVSYTDKKRFAKRYDWLMANAKEQWLDWRCRKITEYYKKLRDAVCQDDPDRSMGIYVMNHMQAAAMYDKRPSAGLQAYEYFRQCGLDMKMLAKEKGISITPSIAPYLERSPVGEGVKYGIRSYSLATDMSPYYQEQDEPAAFIAYHGNLEALPYHQPPKIANYWWDFGSWFGRKNGPHHIFSTPQPPDAYYREFLTHLLAEYDPQRITHGWWGSPDNGNIEEAQKFYAAFRAIPAVKFEDVPGADDPVRVRYYNGKDASAKAESFIYLVNRQYYPVDCTIAVSGINSLTEIQSKEQISADKKENGKSSYALKIKPYEVVCYQADGKIKVEAVSSAVPPEVEQYLQTRINEVKTYKGTSAQDNEELQKVYALLVEAYQSKKYSRVHYLLQSGPVLKYEMNK